jgi:hypothetical protein
MQEGDVGWATAVINAVAEELRLGRLDLGQAATILGALIPSQPLLEIVLGGQLAGPAAAGSGELEGWWQPQAWDACADANWAQAARKGPRHCHSDAGRAGPTRVERVSHATILSCCSGACMDSFCVLSQPKAF